MTKTCRKCLQELPLSQFHKRTIAKDGLNCLCRDCNLAESGQWKRENKEQTNALNRKYKRLNKDKVRCWTIIRGVLRNGTLTRPDLCSECNQTCTPHGHHEDYSKPLDIEWLCSRCHGKRHRAA